MSKVSETAKAWVGNEFRPDVPEQCMGFVRHVLEQAGHPVADDVTRAPVDGLFTGPMLASSLAGRDLGYPLVGPEDRDQLRPGAILFWRNTYGDWAVGTITHVGIYIGSGQFVHRPTKARPVELSSLSSGVWSNLLRCALLIPDEVKPKPATPPAPVPAGPLQEDAASMVTVRLWGHPGGHRVRFEGAGLLADYEVAAVTGEGGAAVYKLRPKK